MYCKNFEHAPLVKCMIFSIFMKSNIYSTTTTFFLEKKNSSRIFETQNHISTAIIKKIFCVLTPK